MAKTKKSTAARDVRGRENIRFVTVGAVQWKKRNALIATK